MKTRAAGVRTIALLRDSVAEIVSKVRDGEWTIDRARAEMGLRPAPALIGIEPIDLTAPLRTILVAPTPTFPPLFPAVDIDPNGGIPG